jgi:carbon starvation protein
MIASVVLFAVMLLALAYVLYGRILARRLALDDTRTTPSRLLNDGVDFVPAKRGLLLGQHFSAIAAAGPIVGPILAALWFGWLPALIWIVAGSIFIGGVHDFASLVASVRHKAASIGEIVQQYMSRTSYVLFLAFVWLALVYVITAFTDITAQTFRAAVGGTALGPGVAASSMLYLLLGLAMGLALYRFRLSLRSATLVFVPLVLLVIWVGPRLPRPVLSALAAVGPKEWGALLLLYCFFASVIPVWLLLQPRGYLGGWLLYLTILVGLVGAVFGGFHVQYPALNLSGLSSLVNGKTLFPVLFITVACGACSGFHGIVSSGTTSKQLARESDARLIGYGAMLLEALVAVLALATVMMLAPGNPILKTDPNLVYAHGLARYLGLAGVDFSLALAFALLAFSTFVYDTLDVCTRLARYILQELLGLRTAGGAYLATLLTLLLPFAFLMLTKEKGYLVAWPIFGTSNQLLASLTLLAVSVWLRRIGKNPWFAIVPMAFMMVMTLWSLVLHFTPLLRFLLQGFRGPGLSPDLIISGVFGLILFVLAIWLMLEALHVLVLRPPRAAYPEPTPS